MRILQVVQKPQRRGAEVFASQLSGALRGLGHDVRTVYLYPYTGEAPLSLVPEGGDCILDGDERHPMEKFPGAHPGLLRRLIREIDEFRPDVVQANGARTVKYGAFAALARPRRRWALVYRNIGDPREWVSGWHYRLFYGRLVMPQLDGIVGVSRTTLNVVLDFYKLKVPAVNIPRGVDPKALRPVRGRDEVRRELGASPDDPVLVFVGSLTPEKRIDRLLRVFAQVRTVHRSARLWIVGDGPLRSELQRLTEAAALADAVAYVGIQANVADYLNAADVFVLTSDTEGIPGAVLEAGMSALPTVATRVGGVAECIQDGETGMLVAPADEAGFAQSVATLLADRDLRRRMGEKAAQWIGGRFAMDRIVEQYLGFYRSCMQSCTNSLVIGGNENLQ